MTLQGSVERSAPRVLTVLSADYGELFNALYFAAGTPMKTCLAAPPKVYRTNEGSLPYATCCFGGIDDLRRAIDDFRPDAALLFSGYLYAANKLMPVEAVEALIDLLDERGVPLATSDPSLGLLRTLGSHGRPADELFAPDHPSRAWMAEHFTRLGERLRGRTHLYLAPEGLAGDGPRLSYFNPRFAFSDEDRHRIADKLASEEAFRDREPLWLFVLAPEDDALQEGALGVEEWTDRIVARLIDAARAGRWAVLLAPTERLRTVGERLGREAKDAASRVTMMKACRYTLFIQLLITAEHAFYWNRFSASILARLINRRPTFSFETGHLAAAMPAVEPVAEQHFYAGCNWPALDASAPLDAAELADRASDQQTGLFDPVLANLRRAGDPADVIDEITAGAIGGSA